MSIIKQAVTTLIAGVAGWSAWQYEHPVAIPIFQTAPAQKGEIRSVVTATGTSSALITVDVGTQVSGIITQLFVDFDSRVQKGQLLAQLDPTQFDAKVNSSEAALNSARAGLTSAQAAEKASEDGIAGARSDSNRYRALTAEATATVAHTKLELDREQQLGELATDDDKATAKTTYESSVSDVAGAKAQQDASDVAIQQKIAERDVAQEQVVVAQAQVSQAEASLTQSKLDLDHTRITSPIDGIILARDVSVGQTVIASSQVPVLFQIAQDLNKMEIDVNLDESDVARVTNGDQATFNVDAYPGVTLDATVRQVRLESTNIANVVTYDVVLDVLHPAVTLFPGMTTNVRILSADHENAIKVPNAALRFRPFDPKPVEPKSGATSAAVRGPAVPKGTGFVYVLDANGKPAMRQVTTGITDGAFTEVVSGEVQAGDALIVEETFKS